MKIGVTGGTGFIGRALVARLVHDGHVVVLLSRRPPLNLPNSVSSLYGDLTANNCNFDKFVEGCDIIFHCAGEVRCIEKMRTLHIDGMHRLLKTAYSEAMRTGRRIHWVQLSSVGAYGPPLNGMMNCDRIVTEQTSLNPQGEYELTKLEADFLLMNSEFNGMITYAILRPSNVFGFHMPNQSLRALISMVRKRLFFYIGKPGAVATYVHVNDVADALVLCGMHSRAVGKIYNLSNDCLLEEMIRGIAKAVGVPQPRLRFPESIVRFAERLTRVRPGMPLTPARINTLVARTKYSIDKIKDELGFYPKRFVPCSISEMFEETE